MEMGEIDAWLARSLDDRRFSRGERQALGEFVSTLGSAIDREALRRRAFEVARSALGQPEDLAVLAWFEEVNGTIREVGETAERPVMAEAYFSPGDDCPRAIGRLLADASKTADICVFTITDDHLSDAILDAHGRGVAVRIITDDAKAEDLGSDVARFERSGIPTRVDRSPFHMHHKFAILDGGDAADRQLQLDPWRGEGQRGEPDRHHRPPVPHRLPEHLRPSMDQVAPVAMTVAIPVRSPNVGGPLIRRWDRARSKFHFLHAPLLFLTK
jgi:hypothetical protein